MQTEKQEQIQNSSYIILRCTRDTPCVVMRFLLDISTIEHRIKMARTQAHLQISPKTEHPLHEALNRSLFPSLETRIRVLEAHILVLEARFLVLKARILVLETRILVLEAHILDLETGFVTLHMPFRT
ncbi:hypothetical protein BsWGS_09107 [Bradybaena similaris]